MKTIGLLGGMSWESTLSYYRLINQGVKARLGGLHSARLILYSVEFAEMEALMRAGDWQALSRKLGQAAQAVEKAGADFLLIGTNTMHKVAEAVASQVQIPLVHIADATAEAVRSRGFSKVGLLGTEFTMNEPFFTDRLAQHGIQTLIPAPAEQKQVHAIIFDQLCQGEVREDSRRIYLDIMAKLAQKGAEAMILGCTEIGLLVRPDHTPIALLDTTVIHAQKAVELALAASAT